MRDVSSTIYNLLLTFFQLPFGIPTSVFRLPSSVLLYPSAFNSGYNHLATPITITDNKIAPIPSKIVL